MKRDRNQRYLLATVIAIFAKQLTGECPQARADEPIEWCQTHVNWVAKVGNQRAVAQGECPTQGNCDRPAVRDLWIPETLPPIVTIRIKFHIFCETDGTNCASPRGGSGVTDQMDQLNSDFAPYRIQFTENTEYIDDSTYREFSTSEEEAGMKNTYADDPAHQINVYVLDFLGGRGGGTYPWDPDALVNMGGIIVDYASFGAGTSGWTPTGAHMRVSVG